MAGFLGWVRHAGRDGDVSGALQCLRHHATFQTQALAGDSRGAGAGAVYRSGDLPDVFEDPERELVVAVLGAVLDRDAAGWRRLSARRLAGRYTDGGLKTVVGNDGAYLILIWDGLAGELHVANDRVGSLPVAYTSSEDGAAFAPEAKALFRLMPLAPAIDLVGVACFLNMGYLIGTRTLFEGVRLLAPAHVLSMNLQTAELRQEQTWVQRFEPDPRLSLGGGADLLYEAILEAHRAPLGRDDDAPWIALTGGYDSRTVLEALRLVAKLPTRAVTWGATDQVPDSDPVLAREFAETFGIQHSFLRYGAEGVAAHAREWVVISELASDNMGYFAAGPRFLLEAPGGPPDALYVGDVVIASGGLPGSVDEAIETVTRVPAGELVAPLEKVLQPDARAAVSETFWREARLVAETCSSSRPEDVQAHLWSQVYNFRWLFSPGFYKEPMLTAWRPMLLGNVYEAASQIPAALRVYKRVYVEMLRRHLHEFGGRPRAASNSLTDWRHDSRAVSGLRSFLEQQAGAEGLLSGPLGPLLEQQRLRGFLSAFFSEQPEPARREAGFTGWVEPRRRLSANPLFGKGFKAARALLRRLGLRPNPAFSSARFVFRLAALNLLCTCIDEGAFGDGRVLRADAAPRGDRPSRRSSELDS